MKLELNFLKALCSVEQFIINDIEAEETDFGHNWDRDPDNAEDYGCGDMYFEAKLATQKILDKYKLTVDEYAMICEKLKGGLSFGSCAWCS